MDIEEACPDEATGLHPPSASHDHSSSSRALRQRRKDKFFSQILTVLQGVGMFVSLLGLYFTHFRGDGGLSLWRAVGLVLFTACYGLWLAARLQLGEAFAVRPTASLSTGLRRSGLYRHFSHPIYLFSLGALVGYALLTDRLLAGCAVALVVVPVQLWRARQEQAVLTATFGDEYTRHMQRVWL